mmetsp:Transcript_36205/g.53097  ORF Transcript_36205/g.53097 Transcript_36205/m.53097 type:complete len:610 (+) Transcript_36205:119-1948(+)
MIDYLKGLFGINLLLRVHGSSVYKGGVLGLVSVVVYLIISITDDRNVEELDHPYAVGVLVSSVSFLIVFRANYGYQRYWEACGNVHHMMSKWLDATTHAGTYHLQCKHFSSIKPPTFFDNHQLNDLGLTRDRERARLSLTTNYTKSMMLSTSERGAIERSINKVDKVDNLTVNKTPQAIDFDLDSPASTHSDLSAGFENSAMHESHLVGPARLDGGMKLATQGKETPINGHTPSLFLQELCHLSSLAVAVAFTTLRNDIDGAASPLDLYVPGQPWPEVDPGKLSREEKIGIHGKWKMFKTIKYWIGLDRTPERRTKYNATRPLQVLGGVSDAEILMLQKARGASAKTQLAWNWLSEFMIREHLAGSMGAVGPPIVSRCFQFLSDGMIYYNHARKVMFIPFPFPSAQISAFFIFVIVFTVPLLMNQYANILWLGATLTFLTVTCLAGLHEAGREMENPFRNIPNDIPLCTLMAMYNESLVTLYNGFHPDFYWDPSMYEKEKNGSEHKQSPSPTVSTQNLEEAKMKDIPTKSVEGSKAKTSPRNVKEVKKQELPMESVGKSEADKAPIPGASIQSLEEADISQLRDTVSKQALELENLKKLIEQQLPMKAN